MLQKKIFFLQFVFWETMFLIGHRYFPFVGVEKISYPSFYAKNREALTGEVLSEAVGRRPKVLLLNLKIR
jgi:hypothetical protein